MALICGTYSTDTDTKIGDTTLQFFNPKHRYRNGNPVHNIKLHISY